MTAPGSPRIEWLDLPPHVRAEVEAGLGGAVVEARTTAGGFSPGVAAVVETADGDRAFVKSAGTALNPESPWMHRREASKMRALPSGVPAPRLRFALDDGDWVTLVFDVVDGDMPAQPWRADELELVLAAVARLACTEAPGSLPSFVVHHREMFDGWRLLAAGHGTDRVGAWERAHAAQLAAIEPQWEDAARGDRLVHSDVRADNALLVDGRAVLVDWAHACSGAPWLDLVLMLPAVELAGGPSCADAWQQYSSRVCSAVDELAVTAVVTAVAGFLWQRSTLPAPPGLPTLREFQRAQAEPATRWLRQRLGAEAS